MVVWRMIRDLAVPVAALVVTLGAAIPAMAQDVAGAVTRLVGSAERVAAGQATPLAVGSPVRVGDSVRTGPESRLEIRFGDDSMLTLGAAADIVLDRFFYDPAAPRQQLEVVKGIFRFVGGGIARQAPDWVRLRTPVGTIGIRGTEFVGGEFAVGMPPGQLHYGFQLQSGAIDVVTPAGTVVLDEPGEGTFLPIGRLAAPTPPSLWSPEATAEAVEALRF